MPAVSCSKCSRVLEYGGDRPLFCAYCGQSLATPSPEETTGGWTGPTVAVGPTTPPGRGQETVDFITDRVLDFLAGFPWNPVQVLIDLRIRRQILEALDKQEITINEERLTDVNLIKRLVMKRCVYGVDLNPMAA